MSPRRLDPPSGMEPPARAALAGGRSIDLVTLAETVADRHMAAHPEEVERYGSVGRQWCVHDNQHLLNWAILDANGVASLPDKVAWLAHVLSSRGYPLESLRDDLLTAAAVVRETGDVDLAVAADRLEEAARTVPSAP